MTNDERNTLVAALRTGLLDVWRWDDIFHLAAELHSLDLTLPPEDPGYGTHYVALTDKLNALLAECLADAVAQVDDVLDKLPPGAVRNAQVAGLMDMLKRVLQPHGCWKQWHARGGYLRFFDPEEMERTDTLPNDADIWQSVEGDVQIYIAQLVKHIEDGSDEVEQSGQLPKNRPRWNGNASELAYLLTELVEADHLIPPPRGTKSGQQGNRAAIAEAVYRAIDIRDSDTGAPVSLEYFKSLMRQSSPDRGTHRDLFKIFPRTGSK